jgi:hypothetical protein
MQYEKLRIVFALSIVTLYAGILWIAAISRL